MMASPNITFLMPVDDQAGPKLRMLHRRMGLLAVVMNVRCPGCEALPGEHCKSRSGKPARPHVLQIIRHQIGHVRSGLFECTPEGDNRG